MLSWKSNTNIFLAQNDLDLGPTNPTLNMWILVMNINVQVQYDGDRPKEIKNIATFSKIVTVRRQMLDAGAIAISPKPFLVEGV